MNHGCPRCEDSRNTANANRKKDIEEHDCIYNEISDKNNNKNDDKEISSLRTTITLQSNICLNTLSSISTMCAICR